MIAHTIPRTNVFCCATRHCIVYWKSLTPKHPRSIRTARRTITWVLTLWLDRINTRALINSVRKQHKNVRYVSAQLAATGINTWCSRLMKQQTVRFRSSCPGSSSSQNYKQNINDRRSITNSKQVNVVDVQYFSQHHIATLGAQIHQRAIVPNECAVNTAVQCGAVQRVCERSNEPWRKQRLLTAMDTRFCRN